MRFILSAVPIQRGRLLLKFKLMLVEGFSDLVSEAFCTTCFYQIPRLYAQIVPTTMLASSFIAGVFRSGAMHSVRVPFEIDNSILLACPYVLCA